MSFRVINELLNCLPGNATAIVEDAVPLVANVTSVAMNVLSGLPYLQIGGVGLLVGVNCYWYLDERDVEARAGALMQGNMGREGKSALLDAIRKIPSGEREDVIQRALPLMQSHMDRKEKSDLLDAIRKIPYAEREDVIQRALPLIQGKMTVWSKAFILHTIQAISSGEREDAIQQALLLMQDDMDRWAKFALLDDIRMIPSEEREDVIQRALPLIRGDMSGRGKSWILDVIQDIPAEEREDVIQRALPLMQDGMDGVSKSWILDAILAIPLVERELRAARAFEQLQIDFPHRQFGDTYVNRVIELLETPLDQAFLPVGRPKEMVAAAAAGHTAINVHAGQRDSRVKEALLLLRKSQEMSEQEIDTAANQCIQYLHAGKFNQALWVLNGPNNPNDYGPFFEKIIINSTSTSGQEVIGRLWGFIHALSESDKGLALHSLVAELEKCINKNGERICNAGKMQHLFIAILQGRLKGVQVDDSIEILKIDQGKSSPWALSQSVPVEAAMRVFFENPKHQEIDELEELMEEAEAFCSNNRRVNREEFIKQIKVYAEHQGMDPKGKGEE